jgi:membrane protease YdiL (CAAX protease family)
MNGAGRLEVFIQLALVTLLVSWFIWMGRHAFAGSTVAFTVLLVLLLGWSHRRRGDTPRALGFRVDTLARTARSFAPIALAIIALVLAVGAWMQSLRFQPTAAVFEMLGKLLLFGIAQQYVLLGFYFRGIAALVSAPLAALLLSAAVFAGFHVPNGFLMVVTFLTGVIAVAIYRRSPNLWVSGLTHGLISFVLFYALPVSVTGGLRIGPEY